ncbi:MAG: pantetheine-phosphate adenylyltransferase [Pseudomonadota bacterium]
MTRAFYPGSFDPFTLGHRDVLQAALRFCDTVVVAIGRHSSKPGLFSHEERRELIEASLSKDEVERIEVVTFDDLATDAAIRHGCSSMVRGLRDGTDLDYEMQLAGMNGELKPQVQTVFVPSTPRTRHITATLVRQVAAMGGDVAHFVPQPVAERLVAKHASS